MKPRGALGVVGSLLVVGLGWACASQGMGQAEPTKERATESVEPAAMSTGVSRLETVETERTLRLAAARRGGAAQSTSRR